MFGNPTIGSILVNWNKEIDQPPKDPFAARVEAFIALLKDRVKKWPLEKAAQSLFADYFDLRNEMLAKVAEEGMDFDEYSEMVMELVSSKAQIAPFSKIANAFSETLAIHSQIAFSFINQMQEESGSADFIVSAAESPEMNYSFFSTWAKNNTSADPRELSILQLINAMLNYELGLIISELTLIDDLVFSDEEKDNLGRLLWQSVEDWATYMIFTTLWTPDDTLEEGEFYDKVEDRVAHLEADHGLGEVLDLESFDEMVNSL